MSNIWLPEGNHQKGWGLSISKEIMEDAGQFTGGGHKLIWHTTQGSGMDGALRALKDGHDAPHVTMDPHTGHAVQNIAFNKAAKSLQHISGPETNRANCIQVEIVGFAEHSHEWPVDVYKRLAALAVLIEHRVSIPRKAGGSFAHPQRLSGVAFVKASGHFGHCHVPGNIHWDPGNFNIKLLFELMRNFD